MSKITQFMTMAAAFGGEMDSMFDVQYKASDTNKARKMRKDRARELTRLNMQKKAKMIKG